MFFRVAAIILIAASCAFCGPVWSLPFDQVENAAGMTGDAGTVHFIPTVPTNLSDVCIWIIEKTAAISLDSHQDNYAQIPDWENYKVDASISSTAPYSSGGSPAVPFAVGS